MKRKDLLARQTHARAVNSNVSRFDLPLTITTKPEQFSKSSNLSFPATGATISADPYLNSAFKRFFDVAFAGSMLFFIAPLLLLIAAAVIASSEGPALFRQRRTGLGGRTFEVLKFRTMVAAPADESFVAQAVPGDARITPLGRFLRGSSLDELPQLINVLRGDMSVVGPRPHAVAHDAVFAEQAPNYAARFTARPGLTGLAQISGARGQTPNAASVIARTRLDIAYVSNASFFLDIKIIFLTIKEVLASDSAF